MMIGFGTDGWRALIGAEFTFANVYRIAAALARVVKRVKPDSNRTPLVVVGYDYRFLSEQFAAWCAQCLLEEGVDVALASQAVPTPAVSVAVRQLRAQAGLMVTASHNPPWFNGIKVKEADGGAGGEHLCRELEQLVQECEGRSPHHLPISLPGSCYFDLRELYMDFLRKCIRDWELFRGPFRVVHDAMFGCGAGYLPSILEGRMIEVIPFRYGRDCLFGGLRPEPILENYGPLFDFIQSRQFDVVLVNDGDADRIASLNEQGVPLTAHEVIALLLLHFIRSEALSQGIVLKSANTSSMIDRICAEFALDCQEVPIGFKVICDRIRSDSRVVIALEESGGIAFRGLLPDRDGILAALRLLELLFEQRRPLSELVLELHRRFGPHAYNRIAVPVHREEGERVLEFLRHNPPEKICGIRVVGIGSIDGIKLVLEGGRWLMFRASGTEPVFRLYAEAGKEEEVEALLNWGRNFIVSCLANHST